MEVDSVFGKLKTTITKQWAFALWIVTFALVVAFGLKGYRITEPRGYSLNFWHYWEVAALVSAIIFNILFYILGFFLTPKMFLNLKRPSYIGVLVLLEMISSICLGFATWVSLKEMSCLLQLFSVFIAALCFLTFDSVMARESNLPKTREDFKASVSLNDKPSALAFAVLLIFAWIYPTSHGTVNGDYEPPFRAFIGGAIAFQMIVSNFVLALIFRKPGQ